MDGQSDTTTLLAGQMEWMDSQTVNIWLSANVWVIGTPAPTRELEKLT